MSLFGKKKAESDTGLLERKDEKYVDRSTLVLTPTRGDIHWRPYVAHLGMMFPPNVRGGRTILAPTQPEVVAELEVGDAYCKLFQKAIDNGFTFAMTLEDDMLPEQHVIKELHDALDEAPVLAAVSALYHTKHENRTPLILGYPEIPDDATPREVGEERGLVEVNVIPMGCALWRLSMFADLPKPWFVTTKDMTQDAYFCLAARERGFRFAVDTRIDVGHHDRTTDTTY